MKIKKIAIMCGAKWYSLRSWKAYRLFWRTKSGSGFGIGPILFWDGS